MSWTSRFGNLGRFSPFTRSPPQGSTVSDADFSYITTDDLKRHDQQSNNNHYAQEDLGPPRDTDVIVLRNKGQSHPVHFPAYSIAKGELSVGQVRDQAGKKMGVDGRRVKLIFKGKTLKDDSQACRREGLRDHDQLLCTVGESQGMSGSDDDEDDEEANGLDEGAADPDSAKRRRNRNKNKKRRNKVKNSGTNTPSEPQGAPPPQARASVTALEKIAALRATLQQYDQEVTTFIRSPPPEPAKREFEHKRLSEMILTQVLLKLDAIETEGDPDARLKRKELVRETQVVLKELDDAAARHAGNL